MPQKNKGEYTGLNFLIGFFVILIALLFSIPCKEHKIDSENYYHCKHKSYKVVTTGMDAFGLDARDTICNNCMKIINKPKPLWYEK